MSEKTVLRVTSEGDDPELNYVVKFEDILDFYIYDSRGNQQGWGLNEYAFAEWFANVSPARIEETELDYTPIKLE